MISVEKLRDDLDQWIFIKIGDDILNMPDMRPEYQHLVKKLKDLGVKREMIPFLVLEELRAECLYPVILRPTFWRLVWLKIKGVL